MHSQIYTYNVIYFFQLSAISNLFEQYSVETPILRCPDFDNIYYLIRYLFNK